MKTILKYIFYLYHLPMAFLLAIVNYKNINSYCLTFIEFWNYNILSKKRPIEPYYWHEDEGAYAEDDVE